METRDENKAYVTFSVGQVKHLQLKLLEPPVASTRPEPSDPWDHFLWIFSSSKNITKKVKGEKHGKMQNLFGRLGFCLPMAAKWLFIFFYYLAFKGFRWAAGAVDRHQVKCNCCSSTGWISFDETWRCGGGAISRSSVTRWWQKRKTFCCKP